MKRSQCPSQLLSQKKFTPLHVNLSANKANPLRPSLTPRPSATSKSLCSPDKIHDGGRNDAEGEGCSLTASNVSVHGMLTVADSSPVVKIEPCQADSTVHNADDSNKGVITFPMQTAVPAKPFVGPGFCNLAMQRGGGNGGVQRDDNRPSYFTVFWTKASKKKNKVEDL